ncbi:guanine nucleotide-binding protein alpha-1 subunit [Planoprotostelium fungivorum]|uniref:Guanine nucleotide-binding protein alpha-1 subunit n=1 Tax=Planoprotostelium fungivorum TaxID=1890364 RepID=A0A2P6NEG8_9EUKA|nr:guanine nucleotide-binding protein alpha-1 subunit [Planoprotostelium fungivorum]
MEVDSVRDTHKEGESIPLPNDILYDPHTGLHRYPFLSSQLIAYINLDSIELMAAGMWIVVNFFKFYRHNSLMGIAYVKLFHYTKDLKYRDAALLLADHLVEMNLNRESFLFSGPEDARLWKIETRGADIKKRPAHTARCSSSAMCLIFWSYLRDLSPHHDEIYLQIVKSLFHHFRGDDRWKVSEGDDYFRAVDQGLMQLALLRMLKMYKRGDDAVTSLNETSIEKEIERTRRDVRENFHEKDDCITYINKRGHPVAWHSIWVISSVLLSDSSVDHMDRISAFQRQFLDGSGLIVGIKGKLEDVHFSNDNFLLLMVAKCAEIRGLPFHVSLDSLWNKFKDHSHWIKIHPQTEAVFALTFDPTDFTQPTAAKLIDQTLSEERGRQVLESKLLLLGAGEAGKSTIQRQIRIQYGEGFTERERLAYKSVVHNNLVSSVKMLIHSAQENGLTISAKEAAEAFDQIDATSFDQKGADLMSQLWADPQIQAAYHLPIVVDSVRYWFEHASRIAAPDYIPDDSDLFRMRAKSVGVNETQFIVEGSSFRLIDVGGQRSERSKWIHCFENVTLVLFCVAINEYDLPVENGQCSYKLQESLKLFTDICNSQWFNSTSVVLLFNKEDLFKEKVEKVDLKVCFPEYTGGLNYNKAMHFLQNKFTGRNQNTNKSVHIYPLVATDKESIHSLFNAVREITKKIPKASKNVRTTLCQRRSRRTASFQPPFVLVQLCKIRYQYDEKLVKKDCEFQHRTRKQKSFVKVEEQTERSPPFTSLTAHQQTKQLYNMGHYTTQTATPSLVDLEAMERGDKDFDWEKSEKLLSYKPNDPITRLVNKVHFWSHRAGLIVIMILLLPIVPITSFLVGVSDMSMALLVSPWINLLDPLFVRMNWKTAVFYTVISGCTILMIGFLFGAQA